MKQIKKTKKTESGRSMIEMVGVLAVMGLITAGAFVLISSAMSSQKISRVDDDVSAIAAGVRLLYNTSDTFAGVGENSLTTLGFTSANPYGGTYAVAPGAALAANQSTDGVAHAINTTFTVTISGLSAAQCNALSNRVWPGGPLAKAACSSGNSCGTAVTATGTATGCNTSGSTGMVRVYYGKVQ